MPVEPELLTHLLTDLPFSHLALWGSLDRLVSGRQPIEALILAHQGDDPVLLAVTADELQVIGPTGVSKDRLTPGWCGLTQVGESVTLEATPNSPRKKFDVQAMPPLRDENAASSAESAFAFSKAVGDCAARFQAAIATAMPTETEHLGREWEWLRTMLHRVVEQVEGPDDAVRLGPSNRAVAVSCGRSRETGAADTWLVEVMLQPTSGLRDPQLRSTCLVDSAVEQIRYDAATPLVAAEIACRALRAAGHEPTAVRVVDEAPPAGVSASLWAELVGAVGTLTSIETPAGTPALTLQTKLINDWPEDDEDDPDDLETSLPPNMADLWGLADLCRAAGVRAGQSVLDVLSWLPESTDPIRIDATTHGSRAALSNAQQWVDARSDQVGHWSASAVIWSHRSRSRSANRSVLELDDAAELPVSSWLRPCPPDREDIWVILEVTRRVNPGEVATPRSAQYELVAWMPYSGLVPVPTYRQPRRMASPEDAMAHSFARSQLCRELLALTPFDDGDTWAREALLDAHAPRGPARRSDPGLREDLVIWLENQYEPALPPARMIKGHRAAEAYAREVLIALRYDNVQVTAAGADEGIDVVGDRVAAQVKMEANTTSRPTIQQLYGAASHLKSDAVFFSLSGYTLQALGWADRAGVACFEFEHDGSITAKTTPARLMLLHGTLWRHYL